MYRREFISRVVTGAVAYGAFTSLPKNVKASADPNILHESKGFQALEIVKRTIEVNGKSASVMGLTGPGGQAGLTLDADTSFNVELISQIDAPTLIHWHGLTPPWEQDGVPDNPAAPIYPGQKRRYDFHLGAGGTHWMHAHTLQEQNLLAAPLIVRTADDRKRDEQEVVVLLHDFSFKSPEELVSGLGKVSGATSAANEMGGMDMSAMPGMEMTGETDTVHSDSMTGMDMSKMDINDIEYDAYLANDRTLDDPQVVTVEKGGRVRVRLINGAAATAFTIDAGRLKASLIAVDGQEVVPVSLIRFPVSMGQRLDIIFEIPKEGGTFPLLALREGARQQTGIILTTKGSAVTKVSSTAQETGPLVGLDMEMRLSPLKQVDERRIDKSFKFKLQGDMAKYQWSIEGEPVSVFPGDRVEIEISNSSMMSHPMHLHGHHFQVTAINGQRRNGAIRDTVVLPSMSSVAIAFDAHNPGRWPFHCHHLYHMVSGMMTYVGYEA